MLTGVGIRIGSEEGEGAKETKGGIGAETGTGAGAGTGARIGTEAKAGPGPRDKVDKKETEAGGTKGIGGIGPIIAEVEEEDAIDGMG